MVGKWSAKRYGFRARGIGPLLVSLFGFHGIGFEHPRLLEGRGRLDALARAEALDNVKGIIEEVEMRGIFQTRKPEGNVSDH